MLSFPLFNNMLKPDTSRGDEINNRVSKVIFCFESLQCLARKNNIEGESAGVPLHFRLSVWLLNFVYKELTHQKKNKVSHGMGVIFKLCRDPYVYSCVQMVSKFSTLCMGRESECTIKQNCSNVFGEVAVDQLYFSLRVFVAAAAVSVRMSKNFKSNVLAAWLPPPNIPPCPWPSVVPGPLWWWCRMFVVTRGASFSRGMGPPAWHCMMLQGAWGGAERSLKFERDQPPQKKYSGGWNCLGL